jgi:DHA1 family multidrug resistance protein-like MFS transporter
MDDTLRLRIFSVLAFAIFVSMLGLGIIVPLLPLYATTLGANGVWVGAIFAGFAISRSVFMPFVGRLSDKTGRKNFIATGLLLYSLTSFGFIFATDYIGLFCVRILQGFCSAMIVPIAQAYVGEIAPPERVGSYMGQFNVAIFCGMGFGPFIGGCIQDYLGMNTDFILMGLLCAVSFMLVVIFLPSAKKEQALHKAEPLAYGALLKLRQVQGILWFRFVNAFLRGSVMSFLPILGSSLLGLNGFQIGLAVSTGVLVTSFLQYPCGRLADRFNRKTLLLTGNLLYACAIALFPLAPNFGLLMAISFFSGVLAAIPLPAATALIVEEGKKYGMGSLIALFNVAMSLGLGGGPLVCGLVYDAFGLSYVFYFSTILGILGTVYIGRLLHASQSKVPPASRNMAELEP